MSSFLQRGEEAFGDGIVVAVAAGSHRVGDPGFASGLAEGEADELAALIGVVNQTLLGLAARDRHLSASTTRSERM